MQTEPGARCTGFLVAPQVAITAAHCLFLPRVGRFIQPGDMHVLAGYRAGAYRAHARVAAFRIPPGFRPGNEAGAAGPDRAVLVHPVAPAADTLVPAPPPAAPFGVRLAGYNEERNEAAMADPACRIVSRGLDRGGHPLLAHDCEATRGTSGAPLVWRRPDGRRAAVGIAIGAAAGAAGGIAVPLDAEPATPSGRSADR